MHRNLIKLAAIATAASAALVVAGFAAAVAPTADPSLLRDGWSSYAGSASKSAAKATQSHRDGWESHAAAAAGYQFEAARAARSIEASKSAAKATQSHRDGWTAYANKRDTRAPGLSGRNAVRDGWESHAAAAAGYQVEAARAARSSEVARAEASPASDRFHWGDFGMGVTATLFAMLLLAGLVLGARQRRAASTGGLT
jgi:hypothetical protein